MPDYWFNQGQHLHKHCLTNSVNTKGTSQPYWHITSVTSVSAWWRYDQLRKETWMSEKYVLATLNSNRFLKMLYCHCFSPVSYRYNTAGTAHPVQWLGYRLLNHAIISWFLAVTRDLSLLQSIQTSSVVHAASYAVETGVSSSIWI